MPTSILSKAALPSVLSFSRSIEPTDGFFYQKDSKMALASPHALSINKRSIRTTMSNRQKPAVAQDAKKMNAEIIKANLQQPEICYLDEGCDTMVASFGVKIMPFDGTPCSCNSPEFFKKVKAVAGEYQKQTQFTELGLRYATNIANGRWLWRNRLVAKSISIYVNCFIDDTLQSFRFAGKQLSLQEPCSSDADVIKLGELISSAFRGEVFLSIEVTADVDLGYGHQAFPSEEMILDSNRPNKQLFHRNGVAGFHAPKIGNAIRTIDTWYPQPNETGFSMPISVEPYGSVTNLGIALRQPADDIDFYTLFDKWMEKNIVPDIEGQHYVMAMLIRGGVFGKSSK